MWGRYPETEKCPSALIVVRPGGPVRGDPSRARTAADRYVAAGPAAPVSSTDTTEAPLMITDAVFAASCNDFEDRCAYLCVVPLDWCPAMT